MITSINNEKIKEYAKLNDKKYRDLSSLFIAPGEHLVEEAIEANLVKEIFILDGEEKFEGTVVSENVMKKLSGLTSAPRVLAVVHKKENRIDDGNGLILDGISDPGNMGTIIRSAVAFGYKNIIISENSCDVYNLKCIRASEGMIFKVNIYIGDIISKINELKDKHYVIYGTDVVRGSKPAREENRHAIVIGSEAKGMRDEVKKECTKFLHIPMSDDCESLNAGVSASLLMYILGENV